MKFNCGPTKTDKRIAREAKWKEKKARLQVWHSYFCWLPVRMTGTYDCRWLERVQRKGHYPPHAYWEDRDLWTWVYKP